MTLKKELIQIIAIINFLKTIKMKKLIVIFWLIVLSCCHLYATRTEKQMKEAAWNAVKLLTNKSDNVSELKVLLSREKLKVYGYDDGGFAVISSDDSFETVIGVSSGVFDDSLPCGFKWWIETVNSNMRNGSPKNYLRNRDYIVKKKSQGVPPLLSTLWGQERPFNDYCTFTNGNSRYECVTGCVATALAQVMNYHRFPLCGSGSISYNITYNNSFTITFAEDFEQSVYDWDNMLDDYSAYYYSSTTDVHTHAVAKLMKDCGVATRTSYSDSSHGSSSSAYYALNALKTYFKYDNSTKSYIRSDYDREGWLSIIYNELDNGRPIFYTGQSGTGSGHAFVLNGYDSTGKVYVNWGWDGQCNGYYDIDLLNPDNNQYNCNQSMIVAVPGTDNTILHSLTLSSNGSGSISYGNDNEVQVRNGSQTFKIKDGDVVSVFFIPDVGCTVKKVKVNGVDVTSNLSNNKYEIRNIKADTTVEVEFGSSSSNVTSEYNKYIVCRSLSLSHVGTGTYERSALTIEVSNSGNSDVFINKVVAKDPETKEILFTLTNTSINGTLEANSSRTYTFEDNRSIPSLPEYEMEYEWDNEYYSYFSTQNRILTIQANDYGFITFANISTGNTAKRFSIEPGGQAFIIIEPKPNCILRKLTVNNSDVTSSVSNNMYTIMNITSNTTVKAVFDSNSEDCTTIDGYEYVDLGLSSGKCWSVKNYGAETPEDAGTYCSNRSDYISSSWGDNWRKPTKEEFQELINECVWSWTERNGINGFVIIGPNDKSIFLPAVGYEDYLFSRYFDVGTTAYYLTSSKNGDVYDWILKATASSQSFISEYIFSKYYPIRPISNITIEPILYKLSYMVDGEVYKTYEMKAGESITPEPEPIKEGYTFSGWSEIPEKMPAHDVTVTGTFMVNTYKLTYIVDGQIYKTYDVKYGTAITPEAEPEARESYIFSGWSEIPATMPSHDVIVTGTFVRHFNVGHVVNVLNFIMHSNATSEDLALYDMNNDGVLNIGDVILIVRNILDYGGSVQYSYRTNADMMTDLIQYTATQFELKTGNASIKKIQLVENMAQSHKLVYKQIDEDIYAIVIYSQMNELLKPVNGNIIVVETDGTSSEAMAIRNITAAKPNGETVCYQGLNVTTGIQQIEKGDSPSMIYDLNGHRLNGSKKGVSIINGKKSVVK